MPRITDFVALIFDMDGLVLDTEPTYCAAWLQAIEIMGLAAQPNAFASLSGQHYRRVEAQLLAWYGEGFNLPLFRELSGEFWRCTVRKHGIPIKPGVLALLDYAAEQQLQVALATNSNAVNAHECLDIAGIKHRFPVIVTGNDVQEAKPAPDIFLIAAKRLQVAIQGCLVFEDSHTGIKAAATAGAVTVLVPSQAQIDRHPNVPSLADFVMPTLLQIFDNLPTPSTIGL